MATDEWIPATPGTVPPSGWILVREAKTGKDFWVNPAVLTQSAPRTELTEDQMARIRCVALALQEHDHSTVETWLENMRRDQEPEVEILTWELIVEVYQEELADRPAAEIGERQMVYGVLVSASMLTEDRCDPGTVMSMFPRAKCLSDLTRIVDLYRARRFGS